MRTVEEIKSDIERLPGEQMRQLQNWLEAMLEDKLEFTDEFKASIEQGKQDLIEGRARYRKASSISSS